MQPNTHCCPRELNFCLMKVIRLFICNFDFTTLLTEQNRMLDAAITTDEISEITNSISSARVLALMAVRQNFTRTWLLKY